MVQCYYHDHNTGDIGSINAAVCDNTTATDGFYSCCFSWSICLPDALCLDLDNEPNFYTAMCTDPSLESESCNHSCDRYGNVAYNSTTDAWGCCQDNCSATPDEIFNAPAPSVLLASTMTQLLYIPTTTPSSQVQTNPTGPSATSASSAASLPPEAASASLAATASSSSPTDNAQKASSGLSAAAGVGIGIAAMVALAVILLAIWVLFKKSRRKAHSNSLLVEKDGAAHDLNQSTGKEKHFVGLSVQPTSPSEQEVNIHELGTGRFRQELEAQRNLSASTHHNISVG